MNEDYDKVTAYHYAAFRPALHNEILSRCLDAQTKYDTGLDIGCGTGYSSIALTYYCKEVVGIEPSQAMLAQSISHPRIKYLQNNDRNLPFESAHFDIITFAGSLYYAKSQELLDQLIRVIKPSGIILIYDFEIKLQAILTELGCNIDVNSISEYDHQEDFSGLEQGDLKQLKKEHEKILIFVNAEQLAHLLLAIKENYEALRVLYGASGLYKTIREKLIELEGGPNFKLECDLFYTRYSL